MFGSIFTTLIVQPIFNILVFIYALIPGHNFGVAIILFTLLARLAMYPLLKKQLYHAKAMREMQPELKKIKKKAKGNRQLESMLVMELYKERQINPFSSIFIILVQLPVFLALYSSFNRVVKDPQQLVDFAYPFIQNMSWMKELAADISKFDATFLGIIDLARPAVGPLGFYLPAFLLVVGSAYIQYRQSKQLMPVDKDARTLRQILRDVSSGKQADQGEVNAAIGRSTCYMIPAFIFIATISVASALSLYWLTSGIIAFWQQSRLLKEDETALEKAADKTVAKDKAAERAKNATEAEIVSTTPKKPNTKKPKKSKRRKKK